MFLRLVLNFRSALFFRRKTQAKAKQTIKEKLIMRGFALCTFGPMPEQQPASFSQSILRAPSTDNYNISLLSAYWDG